MPSSETSQSQRGVVRSYRVADYEHGADDQKAKVVDTPGHARSHEPSDNGCEQLLSRREVLVELTKDFGSSGKLGLGLSKLRPEGVVMSIDPDGAVATWNLHQQGHWDTVKNKIKQGDRLVGANGTRGSMKRILRILERNDKLSLVFRCPKEFDVEVPKGAPLGLRFEFEEDTDHLPIVGVFLGAIQDLNDKYKDRGVLIGDCVVQVNKVRGTASELLKELSETEGRQVLQITMRRY